MWPSSSGEDPQNSNNDRNNKAARKGSGDAFQADGIPNGGIPSDGGFGSGGMVDSFDPMGSQGGHGFGVDSKDFMQDKYDDSLRPPSFGNEPKPTPAGKKQNLELQQHIQQQIQQQQQQQQHAPLPPLSDKAVMSLKVTICGINSIQYGIFGAIVGGVAGGISGYSLGNAKLHAKAGAMSTGAFFGVTNLSRCTLAAVRGKDDIFNVFISGWLGGSAGVLHTRNPRYIIMSGLGSAVLFTVFTKLA